MNSNDLLPFGQQIIASQPFSVYLGAECTHLAEGTTEITLPLRPEHLQQFGFVHGGVISYMADNALTFAGGTTLGPAIVTSEYKINYLRPAKFTDGGKLIARASVIYSGQRQAVCRCDIFCIGEDTEILCATAQGTISRLSE